MVDVETKYPSKNQIKITLCHMSDNVDSSFYPSQVGKMSSSVINGAQVCLGCADRQISPG